MKIAQISNQRNVLHDGHILKLEEKDYQLFCCKELIEELGYTMEGYVATVEEKDIHLAYYEEHIGELKDKLIAELEYKDDCKSLLPSIVDLLQHTTHAVAYHAMEIQGEL